MDKKQNPTPKTKVLLSIGVDTDAMLDAMTDNRSWLVDKLIKDEFLRIQSANRRGKQIRRLQTLDVARS